MDFIFISPNAVADSHSTPLFESMTVRPPSVADVVNRGLDLSCYTCPAVLISSTP